MHQPDGAVFHAPVHQGGEFVGVGETPVAFAQIAGAIEADDVGKKGLVPGHGFTAGGGTGGRTGRVGVDRPGEFGE